LLQNENHVCNVNNKDFRCEECDKDFTRKSNLNCHINSVHKKETRYSCHLCYFATYRRNNLETHLTKQHPPAGQPELQLKTENNLKIVPNSIKAQKDQMFVSVEKITILECEPVWPPLETGGSTDEEEELERLVKQEPSL
jgi:uncharacterized Zn-finger protein